MDTLRSLWSRRSRYAYIARKYWRMNPARLWWVFHVWDEVRADVRGRPADPFRTCFECDRVYPTAADLLAAHTALVAQINRETSPDNPPMLAETDPLQIYACPDCSHDF